MTTTPEWLRPGAKAVILQPWNRAALICKNVTIDRVLKRDVVTSDGDRFRINTLRRNVGGTWGHSVYLVPPDDPQVAKTRDAMKVNRLRVAAVNAYEEWRIHKGPARPVAAAFQAIAELEEEQP